MLLKALYAATRLGHLQGPKPAPRLRSDLTSPLNGNVGPINERKHVTGQVCWIHRKQTPISHRRLAVPGQRKVIRQQLAALFPLPAFTFERRAVQSPPEIPSPAEAPP